MANDTTVVGPEKDRTQHNGLSSTSSSVASSSKSSSVNKKEEVYMNGHSNGEKNEDNKEGLEDSSSCDDDELTKLNSEVIPGSALVRQKSATLTPTSDTENSDSVSNSFKRSYSPGGQNAFMYNARNNLRRSFTLPRGLLLRKTGQSGLESENQNGSFVRNIFLTLVRSKSIRKKSQTKVEDTVVDRNSEAQLSPLEGLPPGFVPAAVGLKNQGNTCFMNAIVQCLSHTDSLAKYLVTDNYKTDIRRKHWIKTGKSEVTDELASILKSAWLKQHATTLEEAVTRFKSAVEKSAVQWRGSEQHDAQEFFLWLLDKLHEDLNQASSNKYKQLKNNFGRPEEQVAAEALANHMRCNNSIVQDIFGAHFRSSLTCPGCGRHSATFDPFLCVSLPIPQAKQAVPVYVNIIYLSQQPRQVKLGLSITSCADIKELKLILAADTSIEEDSILLTEIDGEGFHRTFTETQLVSSLANNDALYCIETPQLRETNENDGAFLMITWTNIVVTNEDDKDNNMKVRFGSTYVTQIARETGFVDLQKILLKEMSGILHSGILVAEQKDPVFNIRIIDGSPEGGIVDPLIEHPLYIEAVDHALSLCDEGVPSHIKLQLEWTQADKDRIIADDSESVEEHSSVAQTRQRHAEESAGSVSLQECFDLYTTAELLSAEDSWHCPHCNRKEQGTLKMIGLWTAPQVLVVHLKRFRQTAKGRVAATKISSLVDFPVEGLDLGPHVAKQSKLVENGVANGTLNPASSPINGCFGLSNWKHRSFKKHIVSSTNNYKTANGNLQNGSSEEGMIYDLYAVCNHHGKDMLGGHYTAFCKNPVDESWWSFDDTRVTKVSSIAEIKTASAYILFYTKRSSSSLNSQSIPIPANQTQHWCKSLVKKYHKTPSLSNSNNVEGLMEKEDATARDNSSDVTTKSATALNNENDVNIKSDRQSLVNGYQISVSTAHDANNSCLSAPLARMDDVGVNVSVSYVNELQIESTV